jgi:hypothetical protein
LAKLTAGSRQVSKEALTITEGKKTSFMVGRFIKRKRDGLK